MRLEQIKINTNNPYQYMKKVEKEYLLGKTYKDKLEYIQIFKEHHKLSEVDYIENYLEVDRERILSFFTGYISVNLPIFGLIFGALNMVLGSIFSFGNSAIIKLSDFNNESINNSTIAEFTGNIGNLQTNLISKLSFIMGFLILFFSFFFLIQNNRFNNRLRFLSYIKSVKNLYNKENVDTDITLQNNFD